MGEELKIEIELKVKDEEPDSKRPRLLETLVLREEIRTPSYWDRLPYPLIVKVYSYLDIPDRRAMARVCRAWYTSFKDPSLWRSWEFVLGGTYAQQRGRNMNRFATRFGRGLNDVAFLCEHKTPNTCKYITEIMGNLTEKLEHARLSRLVLLDLELDKFNKYPALKETVGGCLVRMFKSQTALKHVTLQNCQFPIGPGTDVLKAVQESSGQTIESLNFHDFYQTLGGVFQENTLLDIMTKFTNLREISVNYCYISDEMLQRWTVELKGRLKHVKIKVVHHEHHSHVITSRTWRNLTNACPQLKVRFCIRDISHANQIIPLLSPNIPLIGIFITSDLESAHDTELASTLTHIADNFDKKLESIVLLFPYLQDSVDNEIIRIIEKCRKLTVMRVPATAAFGVATAICNAFRERRVRNVRLQTERYDGTPNGEPYQDIVRTFHDMLNSIPNLNVELVDEE